MRRLLTGNFWRQAIAAAIGLSVAFAVGAPSTAPARGDGKTTIAVNTFQNEAGAPPNVASDLSNSLYQAMASSQTFDAKGGGPLAYEHSLTNDPFADALTAAAKAGADYLVLGSVVQMSGGQAYYRLTLFRVAPVTFVGSQVFAQSYPASDPRALAAGLSANVTTLMAPRQAVGTIYSTDGGIRGDVGSEQGFSLGEHFNVTRGGQKVAEATISSITDDEATLTISNASAGYTPQVGDTLVGLTPLPPSLNPPAHQSGFNPIAILVGVGAALLAIGHHGQPASSSGISTGSPTPAASPFALISNIASGTVPNETITFTFSQLFGSASATGVTGNITYAYVTLTPPGGGGATTPPAPLSSLGNAVVGTITGTGGIQESTVQVGTSEPGLVSGEPVAFVFTTAMQDAAGQFLAQTTVQGTLSVTRHSLTFIPKKKIGPVAPGPQIPVAPKPIPPPKNPPR